MKSLIRSLIAAPKQTHYDLDLNKEFDLVYVTAQLIVSAAAVNSYIKSFYRSEVHDLVKFLDNNHGSDGADWHIWNFRGEEPGYSDMEVRGKVSHYPFPDHQAPSINILFESVQEIYKFLSSSPKNVALLHCKAGKGRSGTICCAYLMYIWYLAGGKFHPDLANSYFTEKRMKSYAGQGVSILSQKRYLSYWYDFLTFSEIEKVQFNSILNNKPVHEFCINKIEIRNFNYDNIDILDLKFKIETYEKRKDNPRGVNIITLREVSNEFSIEEKGKNLILESDYPILLPQGVSDIRISVKGWCYFWFNIYIDYIKLFQHINEDDLNGRNIVGCRDNVACEYSIKWEELDGLKGTNQKGVQRFSEIYIYGIVDFTRRNESE